MSNNKREFDRMCEGTLIAVNTHSQLVEAMTNAMTQVMTGTACDTDTVPEVCRGDNGERLISNFLYKVSFHTDEIEQAIKDWCGAINDESTKLEMATFIVESSPKVEMRNAQTDEEKIAVLIKTQSESELRSLCGTIQKIWSTNK